MIDRFEATRVVIEVVGSAPIIGAVGNATFDLSAFDRPTNFYMWNSMGMASSVALGLALARPDLRIVCLDGDGALLMNLGSLATTSMSGVRNLVHVVWDNGGWDITGGQPAGSPFGVDLEMIARGSGFARTATVKDLDAFRGALESAMRDDERWCIVAHIESGSSSFRPSKDAAFIRDRMTREVAALPPRSDGPPGRAARSGSPRRAPRPERR